jgi:hypothetical protein
MTLRFWRRRTLIPGIRVNLSRSGASMSIGRRGAWYTISQRGQRSTIGAAGTGIFWTQFRSWAKSTPQGRPIAKILFWVIIMALALKFMTPSRASDLDFPIGLASGNERTCGPGAAPWCESRIIEMAARAWSETDSNHHNECVGSTSYRTLFLCLTAGPGMSRD